MENNQIRSLGRIENLTALYAIYAAGNPLTDTSALEVSGCMERFAHRLSNQNGKPSPPYRSFHFPEAAVLFFFFKIKGHVP